MSVSVAGAQMSVGVDGAPDRASCTRVTTQLTWPLTTVQYMCSDYEEMGRDFGYALVLWSSTLLVGYSG